CRGLRDCGMLDLASGEPFASLFTQGMVVHETYKSAGGQWLLPEETDIRDGVRIDLASGKRVEIGDIEKMSKSKKNVVDLDAFIQDFGADVARWFVLSDSPPERDVEWTDAGGEGAWGFVQRVWTLVEAYQAPAPKPGDAPPAGADAGDVLVLRQMAHRAIQS